MGEESLKLGPYELKSRLIMGTGKFATFRLMAEALAASGCEVVTVSVRRLELSDRGKEDLLDHIDPNRYRLLPNTDGCYCADDAVRTAHVARDILDLQWINLQVLGDRQTFLPDPVETLKACRQLVADGFTVLAYSSDDPITAQRLEEAGSAAVMPAAAPIGSGQGILNPSYFRIILQKLTVPVIVDAGLGTASDAAIAMELGADGVLLNTSVAHAKDPVKMATAMRHAIEAGRLAYLAGRVPRKLHAAAAPMEGTIEPGR